MSVVDTLGSAWNGGLARASEWPQLVMAASRRAFGSHMQEEPLLLKPEDVAHLLGLGRSKVYEMIAAGELPVTRIGTAVRVPRDVLLQWIREHTTPAAHRAA
jgi:excisionase family DNA binding protein